MFTLNKAHTDMSKNIILSIIVSLSFLATTQAFTLHNDTVVEIPLDKYFLQTRVGTPTDSVRNQTRNHGASIGINASFFCPAESSYRYCGANNQTSSDRIVQGIPYAKYRDDTGERGIIGVTKDNIALFVQNNQYQGYMGNSNKERIDEIYYGIWNFPILLDKWIDVTEEYSHLIDVKLNTASRKAFICTNKAWDRIYMGFVRIKYLYELPEYIKDTYNCYYAVSLDAGASSVLVINDEYKIWPGRKVVDGFLAIPKPEYIEQQITQHQLTKTENQLIQTLTSSFINYANTQWSGYLTTVTDKIKTIEESPRFYPLADKRAMLRKLVQQIEINITQ